MKFPPFDYAAPADLAEGCELLAAEGARPLAGGQSLLPLMALRMARPELLVDLGRLRELRGLNLEGGEDADVLRVGAMTTHAAIEESEVVADALPILAKVASHIGHAAIRHLGTIGGSVAHADPAAEWPATCVALGAVAEITSRTGVRREPVESLLSGPYQTSLGEGEILSRLDFPLVPGSRHGVSEVAIRAGDFALAGAVCVLEPDGVAAGSSVTVFGVEGRPRRVALPPVPAGRGEGARAELAAEISSHLGDLLEDVHADGAFRRHLAEVAVARALRDAFSQGEAA